MTVARQIAGRVRQAALVVVLSVSASTIACGGSPTSPTPALNLGGAWTGTWTFVVAGATVTDTVTATLTQNGDSAGGQWTAASGPTGQLIISVGSTISGTASISQSLLTGVICTTSTTVSGTATSMSLQFTFGTLAPTGLCQWATGHQFSLTKL